MRIILRSITLNDGDLIVKWRNNENVLSHCLSKEPVSLESNKEFFNKNIITGRYKQFIVERVDEDFGVFAYPIATIYLKDMDYANRKCELCIFTSNDIEWKDTSQSVAIKMLLDKAFTEYGMHKVYSYVFKKFPEEVELLKSAGFTIETTLIEEALNENNVYEDIIRLSVFNKKY